MLLLPEAVDSKICISQRWHPWSCSVSLLPVGGLHLDILRLSTFRLSSILFFASHCTKNKHFRDEEDTIPTLKETISQNGNSSVRRYAQDVTRLQRRKTKEKKPILLGAKE